MKNVSVIFCSVVVLLSLFGCQKEDSSSTNTIQNMMKAIQCDEAPIKNVFMCTELLASEDTKSTKAALLRGKK